MLFDGLRAWWRRPRPLSAQEKLESLAHALPASAFHPESFLLYGGRAIPIAVDRPRRRAPLIRATEKFKTALRRGRWKSRRPIALTNEAGLLRGASAARRHA